MAINRYTQPIKSQYMPTTPNAELTAMMLQKRSADEARSTEAKNVMESEVLGVKAYGEDHSTLLKEKQQMYNDRIGKIYDRYSGDPNASLYAMNELNRQFKRDLQSGDLYDIDYRYNMAQEDIKDAKERYGKGELTESAFTWQMDNAGKGFRAQKNPDMFKEIDSMISTTDYSDDVFQGDDQMAVLNMQQAFSKRFETQLSYMTPEGRAQALSYVENAVWNKWRSDNPGSDLNRASWDAHRGGANVKQGLLPDHFMSNEHFDDNGKYQGVIPLSYESFGGHRSTWGAAFAKDEFNDAPIGANPNVKYQDPEVQARFTKWRDTYNLPPEMTDKAVQEAVNLNMENKSVSFGTDYTLNASDDIHSLIPTLNEGIGNRIATIDDKQVDQGTFFETLADKLDGIDNATELLTGVGKTMLENARISLVSDGEYAGQVLYEIGDVKVYTEAPNEQFELANQSSFNLKNAMLSNTTGQIEGITGVEVEWTNEPYDGVDIAGEWNEETQQIEEVMYYTYNKKRLVYKDNNGKEHFVIANYDDIKQADLDNLSDIAAERKRKPTYS